MGDLPVSARVVVIGAGIVGNSVVGHLAELGWQNIVQIDKGSLPNPGGSTGHASNFIFPVDHNKEMAMLTLDSQSQYEDMGVNVTCGGIEVARTPERMEELRRRMGSAKNWDIEAYLVSPAEIKEMVPFINEKILLGGAYFPTVSAVDSLQAGTIFRERAQSLAALETHANVEVLALETQRGRIKAVVTDKGRVETEYVVIACGVWSPRIARMAGATIPLTPAVHQMIDVGPIPILQETGQELAFPIVRDMDTFMYERQTGGSMEVGSYAHRPIFHHPDEIPSIAEARFSPTELPFTDEDFDDQMEDALELMPEILSTAEIKYATNGLLSLTPDAMPLIGETVEVKNLWAAAAIWIKEGPGTGRAVAEWMTHGYPELDPHASDIARFYPYARTEGHIRARCAEHFNKTYGIVHPREQWASERNKRMSSFHARTEALGAHYFEAGGWERPHWYESNAALVDHYEIEDRPHEWDRRWWSPIQNAEHLAMRERVAMVDLSPFVIFDFTGPGALAYLQHMATNNVEVKVGRSVYTPLLTEGGGFKADLTMLRLGDEHFRVVTGAFDGPRDKHWFRSHLPEDGQVQMTDLTSAMVTIGVWGPKARDLVQSITDHDVSDTAFPYGHTQAIDFGSINARLFRISYVGELGWEIYVPTEQGQPMWDRLWEGGQDFGVLPVGAGVYGTTGRLEKGYRLMGAELESEFGPVEAGLSRPTVKPVDFIGREAYLKTRDIDSAAVLCTLTVEDHMSKRDGIKRFMTGREPITSPSGERLVDEKGRPSYVTSAGTGPSVGKYLLLAYLPPEYAVAGTDLAVMYMDELYPVKVAVAGSIPLFDPDDQRMKY
ncbi:MAG: FAD-dependent oxidoreductase [Acidimicrobiia bacterium]|nr:FAD-dependent oxidoreductase [Acidimicrobiia bacterium]MDQ3500929.1 FAD-dependent oxidoreductase [Actinomycetota bacterium]